MTKNLLFRITGIVKLAFFSLFFCLFLNYFNSFSYAKENTEPIPKEKRNPFIPLVTPDGRLIKLESGASDSAVALEGIIYDQKGLSFAIVNGEVVKVGDKISGYQVLKIEKEKVIFVKEGQLYEMQIKKEEE